MTPSCEAVRAYLSSLRGAQAYHPEYTDSNGRFVGNNGDRLIRLACSWLLKEYEIDEVEDPQRAELIVLDGGALRSEYSIKPSFLEQVASARPTLPLVLMPSSLLYAPGKFLELLIAHHGPSMIFCRERYSFAFMIEEVRSRKNTSVDLDHDVAFEIGCVPIYAPLATLPRKHILIVERRDFEHPSGRSSSYPALRRLSRSVPEAIRRSAYPLFERALGCRNTEYRLMCDRVIQRLEFPQGIDIYSSDISNTAAYSLLEYCDLIATSRAVFTTRLHVGILASLLGIPTWLSEGPYHKMVGVYEHSMASLSNVSLMRWEATGASG